MVIREPVTIRLNKAQIRYIRIYLGKSNNVPVTKLIELLAYQAIKAGANKDLSRVLKEVESDGN